MSNPTPDNTKAMLFALNLKTIAKRERNIGNAELSAVIDEAALMIEALSTPIAGGEDAPVPMILTCPACSERHYDEGEFATKAHHTHACQGCGMVWRPAKIATVGVRFLPGYKNDAAPSTLPQSIEPSEAMIEAKLARLNWQKYNGEQGDEIVYQAEKMATAIDKLIAAMCIDKLIAAMCSAQGEDND